VKHLEEPVVLVVLDECDIPHPVVIKELTVTTVLYDWEAACRATSDDTAYVYVNYHLRILVQSMDGVVRCRIWMRIVLRIFHPRNSQNHQGITSSAYSYRWVYYVNENYADDFPSKE
jgi:hypothetical protein